LPLAAQKTSRVGLRALVKKLRGEAEENWKHTIQMAFLTEPTMYHYVKEQTIAAALTEAGADKALVERILNHPALDEVPADVPRR